MYREIRDTFVKGLISLLIYAVFDVPSQQTMILFLVILVFT